MANKALLKVLHSDGCVLDGEELELARFGGVLLIGHQAA